MDKHHVGVPYSSIRISQEFRGGLAYAHSRKPLQNMTICGCTEKNRGNRRWCIYSVGRNKWITVKKKKTKKKKNPKPKKKKKNNLQVLVQFYGQYKIFICLCHLLKCIKYVSEEPKECCFLFSQRKSSLKIFFKLLPSDSTILIFSSIPLLWFGLMILYFYTEYFLVAVQRSMCSLKMCEA